MPVSSAYFGSLFAPWLKSDATPQRHCVIPVGIRAIYSNSDTLTVARKTAFRLTAQR